MPFTRILDPGSSYILDDGRRLTILDANHVTNEYTYRVDGNRENWCTYSDMHYFLKERAQSMPPELPIKGTKLRAFLKNVTYPSVFIIKTVSSVPVQFTNTSMINTKDLKEFTKNYKKYSLIICANHDAGTSAIATIFLSVLKVIKVFWYNYSTCSLTAYAYKDVIW